MSLPYNIKDLIEKAREERIDSEESERQEHADKFRNMELSFIIRMIPAWRRWYMRKNQPNNYFRITAHVPVGLEAYPMAWTRKFQVWAGSKKRLLVVDERIDENTYRFLSTQPDWEQQQYEPNHFIYRNQKACSQ